MFDKSHRTVFTMLLMLLASNCFAEHNPWAESPVGLCYPSVTSFMEKNYGSDYSADENITVETVPETGLKTSLNHFMWAADKTPSQNYSRILLRVNPSGEACPILLAIASSYVTLEKITDGKLPKRITSTEWVPLGWATQVIYELNTKTELYHPAWCQKIRDGHRKRRIPCSSAFR